MNESVISGIKKMAIGAVIAEMGCYECIDSTKQELKSRVRKLLNAANEVQSFFQNHAQATQKTRVDFKTSFNNAEVVLLCEIFSVLYDLGEADLEIVLTSLKENIKSE